MTMIAAGEGVNYTVNGTKLVIEVDLTGNFGLSSSGKTITVASTNGFAKLPGGLMFSVNVNKKPQ